MKNIEMRQCESLLSRRERMVGVKISPNLYAAAKACIDHDQYKSMNDVVEIALFDFVQKRAGNKGDISFAD